MNFWGIKKKVINNGNSTVSHLFNGPEVLFLHLKRQNCERFSNNLNLEDSCISLHTIPSRTNLNLRITSVNLKLLKVITSLDSSKVSYPNFIPVVVLKNNETKLSQVLGKTCRCASLGQ